MKRILLILSIVIYSCADKEYVSSLAISELPKDEINFQKMIIGQLTGEQEIMTLSGEALHLKSRWNKQERRISLDYFESIFDQLNLKSYRHHYSIPNSNFLIDLLVEPLEGTNIYALLPATINSAEYVVLGAHYDTDGDGFPGAIDNGSGVALITSVLRQARELSIRNRNLIAVYFDQEEEGISAGSLAFAQYLKDKEYVVHSAHSFDLIGWDGDKNKEVQLELPISNPKVENMYLSCAKKLDIPISSITANASDYSSFYKMGINTIGVSQAYAKGDLSGKKDSPEDKYDLVDFDYLESSTSLVYEVVKNLLYD